MRERNVLNCPGLIASNYKIIKTGDLFFHEFTPQTTQTVYRVVTTSSVPVVEEGEYYNVAYNLEDGIRLVDPNSIVKITVAGEKELIRIYEEAFDDKKAFHQREKAKNEARVKPYKKDGKYYWGKKYAWRVFGIMLSKDAFYNYLKEINHTTIPCIVFNEDRNDPPGASIAYQEEGIKEAIETLLKTAEPSSGKYYKSPHFSKKFTIKTPDAFFDKK
jgi:hypothetical protein